METEETLLTHLSSLLSSNAAPESLRQCNVYVCSVCQLSFEERFQLDQHLKHEHISLLSASEEQHSYFLCTLCTEPFSQGHLALRHAELRHKDLLAKDVLEEVNVVTHVQHQVDEQQLQRHQVVLAQREEQERRRQLQQQHQGVQVYLQPREPIPLPHFEAKSRENCEVEEEEDRLVIDESQQKFLQQGQHPEQGRQTRETRGKMQVVALNDTNSTRVNLEFVLDDKDQVSARSSRTGSMSDGTDINDSMEIVMDDMFRQTKRKRDYRRDLAVHVRRERDRRQHMGKEYERLAELSSTTGCSKVDILRGATSYIRRLENDQLALAARLIELKDKHKALWRRRRALENHFGTDNKVVSEKIKSEKKIKSEPIDEPEEKFMPKAATSVSVSRRIPSSVGRSRPRILSVRSVAHRRSSQESKMASQANINTLCSVQYKHVLMTNK